MKLTIVSPTYNEAENIGLLVQAISGALDGAGIDYEILIVDDDSPDLTWQRASEIGRMNPSVRVLRRTRAPGLSASVIEGFSNAQGEIVACIDADLQHDPVILPEMLEVLGRGSDVVVGSRYMPEGRVDEWSWVRRLESWIATTMAQIVLGIKLSDPVSGYFMMRKDDFMAARRRLNPDGFKILLEVLVQLPGKVVTEVPYTFRPRTKGQSKLSRRIVFQFLHQLWRLARLKNVHS